MVLSSMLAEKNKLIEISLFSCSPGWTNKAELQNLTSSSLTLLSPAIGGIRADESRNISTAESPGR